MCSGNHQAHVSVRLCSMWRQNQHPLSDLQSATSKPRYQGRTCVAVCSRDCFQQLVTAVIEHEASNADSQLRVAMKRRHNKPKSKTHAECLARGVIVIYNTPFIANILFGCYSMNAYSYSIHVLQVMKKYSRICSSWAVLPSIRISVLSHAIRHTANQSTKHQSSSSSILLRHRGSLGCTCITFLIEPLWCATNSLMFVIKQQFLASLDVA
jgi:hypothetical protein